MKGFSDMDRPGLKDKYAVWIEHMWHMWAHNIPKKWLFLSTVESVPLYEAKTLMNYKTMDVPQL